MKRLDYLEDLGNNTRLYDESGTATESQQALRVNGEPFTPGGVSKAAVEGDKTRTLRPVLHGDERRGKLKRVGRAQLVGQKQRSGAAGRLSWAR